MYLTCANSGQRLAWMSNGYWRQGMPRCNLEIQNFGEIVTIHKKEWINLLNHCYNLNYHSEVKSHMAI